uniref:LisH domain-containing protein n=1 Tax=Globodera rostochiensis TaxID=31243 RepID=A0A914HSH6_GLORO
MLDLLLSFSSLLPHLYSSARIVDVVVKSSPFPGKLRAPHNYSTRIFLPPISFHPTNYSPSKSKPSIVLIFHSPHITSPFIGYISSLTNSPKNSSKHPAKLVNLLVYRYLEESGFRHSAFTFGYECNVLNAGIDGTAVPRGALLSLLQKGVLFSEAEAFALLNDGEFEARFEKAIGSLNILECTLCDATKMKALQRRVQQKSGAGEEQQQQSIRVPSRAPMLSQTGGDHQTPSTSHTTTTAAATATTTSSANLARPESTSSVKSSLSSSRDQQQHQQQQLGRLQPNSNNVPSNAASFLQQQQSQRGAMATYRTSSDLGSKVACIPQATTSTGTVASSNHLHPQTAASIQAQFYQHFVQLNHSPIPDAAGTPFNITSSNVVSNGVLNGPQQQQLASSMASFPSLGGLHHHQFNSHPLKPSESAGTHNCDIGRRNRQNQGTGHRRKQLAQRKEKRNRDRPDGSRSSSPCTFFPCAALVDVEN